MPEIGRPFAGLDLGSSKVTAVIGEYINESVFRVHGGATVLHGAVTNSRIINIIELTGAVEKAVSDAIMNTGRDVDEIVVGFSAGSINSLNTKAVAPIKNIKSEVTDHEIALAIDTAKADFLISADKIRLQAIPQFYRLDKKMVVKNPVQMNGQVLEACIHNISCAMTDFMNIQKCVLAPTLPFDVSEIVLNSLPSSNYILEDGEKDLGAVYIDIGSEFTDYVVFLNDAQFLTGVISLGGKSITASIREKLVVSTIEAEALKIEHGYASEQDCDPNQWFQMPAVSGRPLMEMSKKGLAIIIDEQLTEIFTQVKQKIESAQMWDNVKRGVVLTGGTANIDGILQCASRVFGTSARIGHMQNCEFADNQFDNLESIAAISLAKFGADRNHGKSSKNSMRTFQANSLGGWAKFVEWLKEFF